MSLSIQVRSDDGAVIVTLAGAADIDMLQPLRAPLTAALADARVLVLDLDELSDVDPGGLRAVLVGVLEGARGGRLRVAARAPRAVAALVEARVHHLVPVHGSVADALADDVDEVAR